MDNAKLKNTIEALLDTFLEAGKIAKELSKKGIKITIKPDKSPVTENDFYVGVSGSNSSHSAFIFPKYETNKKFINSSLFLIFSVLI